MGSASWATNVGNEYGQVLTSVLTVAEGAGLDKMAEGLMRRYEEASEPKPDIIYVDRDCCGRDGPAILQYFKQWKEVTVRLDIWHFMRRIARGCTTESHALYGKFMSGLSNVIFVWDSKDLDLLIEAKSKELKTPITNREYILTRISREELMKHCKRTTRSSVDLRRRLREHIKAYVLNGTDLLNVPLLDKERCDEILKTQLKHVNCIQDPPSYNLYTQVGTIQKGGIELPVYRCSRGSTSLESFHLHLNAFIPGRLIII